jgi:hypothetical protein
MSAVLDSLASRILKNCSASGAMDLSSRVSIKLSIHISSHSSMESRIVLASMLLTWFLDANLGLIA